MIVAVYGFAKVTASVSEKVLTTPVGEVYLISSRTKVLAASVGAILAIEYVISPGRTGVVASQKVKVKPAELKRTGSRRELSIYSGRVVVTLLGSCTADTVPV